jgi:2-polyprenyl-3-methyl-5-hydroxy-6-metoxy-1,4-benzoquinol methylase
MSETENYFQKHGGKWVEDAYKKGTTIAHGRFEAVSKIIAALHPDSIIDIGCGDGRFLESLPDINKKIGLDYSESMLALARTNNTSDIQYATIDLNSAASLNTLSDIPKVEVVTMMGVIHYLKAPSTSLKSLRACMQDESHLVISFRNKLYNINSDSKYFPSELTQKNLSQLLAENNLWKTITFQSDDILASVNQQPTATGIVSSIIQNNAMEGETDPYWNPDAFENWRQFTPLEAVLLLNKSGFKSKAITPIHVEGLQDLSACTSFIITATSIKAK